MKANFSKILIKQTLSIATLLAVAATLSACQKSDDATTPTKEQAVSTQGTVNSHSDSQAAAHALNADSDSTVVQNLQNNLDKTSVKLSVRSARETEMAGVYWVSFDDAPSVFTDKKGEFLIQGDIIKLTDGKPIDLATQIQKTLAKDLLGQVDTSGMIIYPAKGETKAIIHAFTDPTCYYCQKLHEQIDDITAQGIEVRYLAWPRSQEAVPLTEAVWCSDDKNTALTQAKQGKPITASPCTTPINIHKELGSELGISGTPAIFTESGELISGYLPTDELVEVAMAEK